MTKHSIQGDTLVALRKQGLNVCVAQERGDIRSLMSHGMPDITHVFNSWPSDQSLQIIEGLFDTGPPIVFSPHFRHLGEMKWIAPRIIQAFLREEWECLDEALNRIAILSRDMRAKEDDHLIEYQPGYFNQIRQMIEMADEVICLSNHEKSLLWSIGAKVSRASIVRLGVDTHPYADADESLFARHFGIKDYVLCVGSVETRNNQLLLARALRDVDVPLIFIGTESDPAYCELVRANAGPATQFLETPDPESGLLASALAGCRLFVLPSFCESAPVAALQASAAGAPLLLSNRSAEQEYFGDMANYFDPADFRSLKETVLSLYESPQSSARRRDLQEYVQSEFSIDKFAAEANQVYQRALSKRKTRRTLFGIPENAPICIDITSLVHATEPLTNESRAELMLIREFVERYPDRVNICQWDNEYRFLTKQAFLSGEFSGHAAESTFLSNHEMPKVVTVSSLAPLTRPHLQRRAAAVLPPESILLIPGTGWMKSKPYAKNVHNEVKRNRLRLIALVSDDLPFDSPQVETDTNLRGFRFGCSNLLRDVNLLLTFSTDSTERLRASFISKGFAPPPIKTLQVGCSAAEVWTHFEQSLRDPSLPLAESPRAATTRNVADAGSCVQTSMTSVILIGLGEHVVVPLPDDATNSCNLDAEARMLPNFPHNAIGWKEIETLNGRERPATRDAVPLVDVETIKQEILHEYRNRKSINRILLECTHTISTDVTTGIQRVVRNVIREMQYLQRELGFECVPVIIKDGEFYNTRQTGDRQALGGAGEKIQFTDRDILLFLDASWHLPAWTAVREAREQGCRIGCVYYDLIPVHLPQFCDDNLVRLYRDWIDQSVQHADFFIAISKHTSQCLEDYARSSGLRQTTRPKQFASFQLGADFTNQSATGEVRPELCQLFSEDRGNSPYLCVGTIEPRKNHKYVLDAFDLVWQQDNRAKLCLAGRVGWKCDELIARVRGHALYGKSLFMFNDLSDAELRFCYQRGKMLILPSIIEGFGLPIIEALHFGLATCASDTLIHREVGEDYCSYFDLEDPRTLADIIFDIERNGHYPAVKSSAGYRFTTWRESCRELLTKCLALSKLPRNDATVPAVAIQE